MLARTGYFTAQPINMDGEHERTHDDGHRHAHHGGDGTTLTSTHEIVSHPHDHKDDQRHRHNTLTASFGAGKNRSAAY
jgi:hypothetical protein